MKYLIALVLIAIPSMAPAQELLKKTERLELTAPFHSGLNRYIDYETGNILYIFIDPQTNQVEMAVAPNKIQEIQQESNRGPLRNGRQR